MSLDRRLIRRILLHLAQDIRGETSDRMPGVYRQLGFLRGGLARLRSWCAMTRAKAAADLSAVHRGTMERRGMSAR